MSGISPVAPTHMDRLQNHVTGSLLLNMIDNTAKLNKKITSSSSSLNEDLNALQTKVNQMYDSVTQAADKAEAAAKVASDAKAAAEEAADKVAAIIDPVLKKPTGGADQTISGKLIATDFTTSGGVSLTGLADSAVLKSSSTAQTISGILTVDALRAEESIATGGDLTVRGEIQSDGNVTIGDSEESKTANLSVNGQITSGNVTIGKPSTATEADPDLNVDGLIKTDGLTVGEETVTGNLKVNGVTTTENNVIVGSTTGADLTVYGNIKTIAESTVDSKTTERTLTINGQGIKLTEKENGNEEEGENILQLDVSDGIARVWSETANLELKSNKELSLEATSGITLDSPTQVNADMTIGTAEDNPKKKLTVNGTIESTGNITTTSGTITAANIASNGVAVTSGDISTTNGSIVVQKSESGETLQLSMTSDDKARIWTDTPNLELKSNNKLSLEGTTGINLNSPTQVNADMTIGTSTAKSDLTVNGQITSGNVTIGKKLSTDAADLTVNGDIKSTGTIITNSIASTSYPDSPSIALGGLDDVKTVTIRGETSIGADGELRDLTVYGTITSNNLTVNEDIESTGTITADEIITNTITAAGTSITLDSPTQVNADMTIGTSTDNPQKKLTVHGEIEASDFKSGNVTLTGLAGDAVLKSSTSDQTISGKLIASDFKSGNVTLTGLAGDAVLKSSTSAQTISSDLKLSDGMLTIGSNAVDKTLLDVKGNIESTGTITADDIKTDTITTTGFIAIESSNSGITPTLQAPKIFTTDITSSSLPTAKLISFDAGGVRIGAEDGTKTVTMRGNTTIGTDTSSKNLTVNGSIESKGDVTIGTSTTGADLTVYGDITATDFTTTGGVSLSGLADSAVLKSSSTAQTIYGNVIIGTSSKDANLSVNGVTQLNGNVTVGSSSLDDDADLNVNGNITSKTLQVNGVIAADNVTIGTSTTGDAVDLTVNGPTKLNGNVTIGASTTDAGLTVNGNITSYSLESSGPIMTSVNVTIGKLIISYDSGTGTVTFRDPTTIPEKSATIQLIPT